MKFVLHTASRLSFLGLLVYSTIDLVVVEQDEVAADLSLLSDEELRYLYLSFRGVSFSIRDWCVFMWITGLLIAFFLSFCKVNVL